MEDVVLKVNTLIIHHVLILIQQHIQIVMNFKLNVHHVQQVNYNKIIVAVIHIGMV